MSLTSTLLIPILKEILINEIGESNISPLKWEKINGGFYKFPIKTNTIQEDIEVSFEPLWILPEYKQKYLPLRLQNSENSWNVAYGIQGNDTQFEKSDLKTLLTVLSTIIDIIKDFILNKQPDALLIKATEKNDGDKVKSDLYKAYIKKQIHSIPSYYSTTRGEWELIINDKFK